MLAQKKFLIPKNVELNLLKYGQNRFNIDEVVSIL